MRAPNRSAPTRFAGVTVVGITTVAGTPKSFAASATAWAWLPDEGAITPRSRAAGARRDRYVKAPRNLNAPPRWSISGFTKTGTPIRSVMVSKGSKGVRVATPANPRAALSMSARVTSSISLAVIVVILN